MVARRAHAQTAQLITARAMRHLLPLLALAAASACQPAAPAATAPPAAAAPDTAVAHAAAQPAWPPLPQALPATDTLTPAMRAVLRGHDLAQLWQHPSEAAERQLDPFEGFFGPEHYHFALVLTQVTRDAADPAVYHLAGKTRYFPSHGIRPFTGTLTVRQLAALSYPGFLAAQSRMQSRAADSLHGQLYTAHARLQLREVPAASSGVFEGEALLDFYTVPGQPAGYVYVFDHEGTDDRLPTRGGNVVLRGSRRNLTTGQVKPFVVSPDVAAVAPGVLQDFMLDERMGQINPRYARLGWADYWQNDEWWADSLKPKLNL